MSDLGDMLRRAREQKNLSLAQVAADTRIRESFLEAIEQGEYSLLPGATYTTGFLRNYARYLGFHPDEVVEEYYAYRPPQSPTVKPATRVLASGHHRAFRARLLWTMATVILLLAGGWAIKTYNDAYGKTTAPLNLTPANLGAPTRPLVIPSRHPAPLPSFHFRLRATSGVWVRVTADGRKVYEGILAAGTYTPKWTAHHSMYVLTYNGSNLRAFYNGTHLGKLAPLPGLMVDLVGPNGVHRIA